MDHAQGVIRVGSEKGYLNWIVFYPIWRGMIENTVLWTIVLCMTWYFMLGGRRKLRHRDDLCRGCGYVVIGLPAGAVCPECGRHP